MLRAPLLLVALSACGAGSAEERATRLIDAGPQDLEIRFIDVGQGDAVLLRQGSHVLLVDAGLPDAGFPAELRALGVDSLQVFVASHNHEDHIGGAGALLQAIPVGLYLENDAPVDSPSQLRVNSAIQRHAIPRERASRRIFTWGDARLDVWPPPPGVDDAQNNHSMVVGIQRGRFRALLTGDSERSEIDALLAQDSLAPVDLLKAPHHGDPKALSPEWLERLRPSVVVVSVGAGNLPRQTLQRYASPGRRLLRTDRDGDVIVVVDSLGDYTVRTGPRRTH